MPLLTKKRIITLLGLAALGTLAYARLIEPKWLRVRYVPVRIPGLPKAFHDYRIAHLSDIHMGTAMNRARLQEAVELVNLINPDLVAITGDFIDRTAGQVIDDLAGPLCQLKPRDAAVAVMGNHDYYHGVNGVRRMLRDCGIHDVSNSIYTLRRGADVLHIAGVDDLTERHDQLDLLLDQLPAGETAVLLSHVPDFADLSAPTGRFALQLSGHTHGGQVRLPWLGAPVLPSYGRRYPVGLYQVGQMQLYTNQGLGTIPPHVRLGARPEIAVIILETPR